MADGPSVDGWNKITGLALIVALLLGAIIGFYTGFMNGVFMFLVVSGLYLALSFFMRDNSDDSAGPTAGEGAIMGGILLAGIGVCGFIHYYLNDVMITAACLIAVMLLVSGVMIVRNRRYL